MKEIYIFKYLDITRICLIKNITFCNNLKFFFGKP